MPSVFKYNGNEIIDSSGKVTAAAFPTGSIVQVQSTQYGAGNESCLMESMSTDTNYVLQDASTSVSGGGVSGILDVNITPKITGSKMWLQTHVFGEASSDSLWNLVFFFWRSVGSTHTKLASGVTSSSNAGAIGIGAATRTQHLKEAGSSPDILNMQYFDTHGINAGTQITYKVGITTGSGVTKWATNRCISTANEVGVSSICAIELAP